MAKPLKWIFLIALVLAAGAFLSFSRMYRNDIRELERFRSAYERLDAALSGAVESDAGGDRSAAGDALAELQDAAAMRISSLIRNDAELMDEARAIAALSRQEIDTLGAFRALPGGPSTAPAEAAERARLSEQARTIREKRAAAYSRFLDLAGSKGRTT